MVKRTPVRTGLAKGNWRIAFEGRSGSRRVYPTRDPVGTVTIQNIIQAASVFAARSSFVLYNNVPYIERLESGWSRQAPHGMVALSLLEFNNSLRTLEREIIRELEIEIKAVSRVA